ncbi:MAG TPA: hypothetical protein VGS80_17480 [Ktedonobacterales bacterium]|nr:hypothetical protein [Ktedonobacterales bacterium]
MGYESQMRDERRDPNQPDHLFEPADAGKDYGAHGAFDTRSIEKSYETWTAEHKGVVAAATAGAGAGAAAIGFAATLALFGRRA